GPSSESLQRTNPRVDCAERAAAHAMEIWLTWTVCAGERDGLRHGQWRGRSRAAAEADGRDKEWSWLLEACFDGLGLELPQGSLSDEVTHARRLLRDAVWPRCRYSGLITGPAGRGGCLAMLGNTLRDSARDDRRV